MFVITKHRILLYGIAGDQSGSLLFSMPDVTDYTIVLLEIDAFESRMVELTGQKDGCFVSRWTDSELFFERKQLIPALQQLMITYSRAVA